MSTDTPSVAAPLYTHEAHPHTPRNANTRHAEERQARIAAGGINGFNERLAIKLSNAVSTMWTAYAFTALAVITIFAVLGWFGVLSPTVAAVGEAVSQTFIQLVFLPILALVSRVQSRQGELQADEQYHTSLRNSHDIGQLARHQDAQDAVLIEIRDLLLLPRPRSASDVATASLPSAETPAAETTATPSSAKPRRRARSATPATPITSA